MSPITRGEHNMARKVRSDKGVPRGAYGPHSKGPMTDLRVKLKQSEFDNLPQSFIDKEKAKYAKQGFNLIYEVKPKRDTFIQKIENRIKKNASDSDEEEAMYKVLESRGLKLKKEKDLIIGLDKKQVVPEDLKKKVEEMVPVHSKADRSHGDYFHMATEEFYNEDVMKEINKMHADLQKISAAKIKEAEVSAEGKKYIDPKSLLSDIGSEVRKGNFKEAAELRKTLLEVLGEANVLRG